MAHASRHRVRRTYDPIAEQYGFVFAGPGSSGHWRYVHRLSGLPVNVCGEMGDYRTVRNTKRTFKRAELKAQEILARRPK